jgi:indole-3-glycerol phosphate synthase
MPTKLEEIIASTRRCVAESQARVPRAALEQRAALYIPRGFAAALRSAAANGPAVIAELKKASPSKGVIRGSFHPAALALELSQGGAAALSVLTNEQYFQGSLDYLVEVSAAVPIPLLRKDFIIDEYQVLEARANCADAILLIVAALRPTELSRLHRFATELGLDVLTEIHDERELNVAVNAGCDIIGVNNRNLHTFAVDLNTAIELAPKIPGTTLHVAESGIGTRNDIDKLRSAGYHAFLIGESLMRKDHPGHALSELLNTSTVTSRCSG